MKLLSILLLVISLSYTGVSYAGHCSGGHDNKKSDSCSENHMVIRHHHVVRNLVIDKKAGSGS